MARQTALRLFLAFLMLALTAGPVAAAGDQMNFVSPLWGRQEVPARETLMVGTATFKLNSTQTELSYKLVVANGVGITQSHIHCGAPGVNGPVVAFLFGFVTGGVDNNGVLAQGTITEANLLPRAPSTECPEGVANFAEMIERLRSGDAYTNVHTVLFPGGEIRGEIQ
jgi:CHRD domain